MSLDCLLVCSEVIRNWVPRHYLIRVQKIYDATIVSILLQLLFRAGSALHSYYYQGTRKTVLFLSIGSSMGHCFLLLQYYCYSYSLIYDATFARNDDVLLLHFHFPYLMEFDYGGDEEAFDGEYWIHVEQVKTKMYFLQSLNWA